MVCAIRMKVEMTMSTSIYKAAVEAVRLANLLSVEIEFDFNGESLEAFPQMDFEKIINKYHLALEAKLK